jgi:glutathione synthase
MRVFTLANDVTDIAPTQTTAMLALAASARGWESHVLGVGDLELSPGGRVRVRTKHIPAGQRFSSVSEGLAAFRSSSAEFSELEPGDLVMLRTNPARDQARRSLHDAALDLARIARESGVKVVNDPDGLVRARSKLSLARLAPNSHPKTLVSRDAAKLTDFFQSLGGRGVLKPAEGTRGASVFLIFPDQTTNLRAMIESVCRDGYAMAQAFAPGAEEGDIRLVLLDGEALEINGHLCAIRRRPAKDDFRSNLHSGGKAEPVQLTDGLRRIAAELGPRCRAEGLRLVGLDVIGDLVIELNVYATGGLRDAERFSGQDFSAAIVERLAGVSK